MTLSLVGIQHKVQLQILKKLWLALASFMTLPSHMVYLFIYFLAAVLDEIYLDTRERKQKQMIYLVALC